ncbi:MAG: helix-turn-helix domain-containing protein [Clostridia bacterium]|nr:helix-turn-helix domain-containing protein [Clostridia bacterium]
MTETVFSQQYGCNVDLYFGGEREKTFNHEYGPIKRSHFIITLVRNGSATLFTEDKHLTFGEGDIIIMFPEVEYHYRAHGNWSIKWVGVGSADLGLFLERLGITPASPIVKCCNREKAETLLNDIYGATKTPSPSQIMKLKALLCELISIIAESREKGVEPRIARSSDILAYIASHYTEDIKVSEIAKTYHIDRSHLERSFKKETGSSVRETIINFRIKKAQTLLRETSFSVSEIAKASGFRDRLYFSKFFHKKFGMTPSQYREQSKTGNDRLQNKK